MFRTLSLLLWSLVLGVQGAAAARPNNVPIQLDVSARAQPQKGTVLTLKLTNLGETVLRFSIGAGPWAGEGQINLVAIKLPSGVAIPNEQRAMIEPQLGPMELQPGQSRTYDVPLSHLYPELAEELKKGTKAQFVLFWTYQLVAEGSARSARIGGWLPLPGQ